MNSDSRSNLPIVTRSKSKQTVLKPDSSASADVVMSASTVSSIEEKTRNIIECETKSSNRRNSFIKIIAAQDSESVDDVSVLVVDLRNKLAEKDMEVIELRDNINLLLEKVKIYTESIRGLRKEVTKLTEINDCLKKSNKMVSSSKSTQTNIAEVFQSQTQTTSTTSKCITEEKPSLKKSTRLCNNNPGYDSKKPKLLLLGDSQARDGLKYFEKTGMYINYNFLNIFKPNANFSDVVADIGQHTKDYNERDTVLIMAGTNNVLRGLRLESSCISEMLSTLHRTNVVIISIPYQRYKPVLDRLIYEANQKLYEATLGNDYATFIDVNQLLSETDYRRNNVHLSHGAKLKLFSYIQEILKLYYIDQPSYMEPDMFDSYGYGSSDPRPYPVLIRINTTSGNLDTIGNQRDMCTADDCSSSNSPYSSIDDTLIELNQCF